jgi:hypothetical protein
MSCAAWCRRETMLGHDALKIHLAHAFEQGGAVALNVVGVSHPRFRNFRQPTPEFLLAVGQFLRSQVLAIAHQQIERKDSMAHHDGTADRETVVYRAYPNRRFRRPAPSFPDMASSIVFAEFQMT